MQSGFENVSTFRIEEVFISQDYPVHPGCCFKGRLMLAIMFPLIDLIHVVHDTN